MSKWMDMCLQKCCLLRFYFYLSPENFDFGSYSVSITKTDFRNIGALIRSMEFLSPEIVFGLYQSNIRPSMEYCCHVWAGAPKCHLHNIDMLQERVSKIAGTTLADSLESLTHCHDAASLSLF